MKRILFYLTALFFITISPLLSYGAESQQQATTPEVSQNKKEYEKTMQERLKKLGKQLDELNAKAAAMTKEARTDVNQQLAEAGKKEKAAWHKLKQLRKKSEKEWKKFTTEVNQAADDFEKAYESAKSRFKE